MKAVLAFAVLAIVAAVTESSVIHSDSSDIPSPLVIEYTEVIDLSNDDSLDGPSSSSADHPQSRSNFHWGSITGFDRRLEWTFVSRPAIPNTQQRQTVQYRGNINNIVSAVQAFQNSVNQGVSAAITGGGIGQSFVAITFTSSIGGSIFYTVEFWGR